MNKVKKDKLEKKNSPHFNVLDAIIILLVILVIVGIYFRYNIIDFLNDSRNKADYAISYTVKDIRYTTNNYVHVGDTLYFADSGDSFGALLNCEPNNQEPWNKSPASQHFTISSGEVVEAFYPNDESRIDAKGRLLCEGYYSEDGGFLLDGDTYIAPGQTISVRTELVSFVINVTSIELYEGQ